MIIAVLLVLGICFGSFVNALVWRLHEQEVTQEKLDAAKSGAAKSKLQTRLKDLSISKGRSMCVDCSHTLDWFDLIPVLSWLSVGGKCRYCRKPISWQYPVVEVLTAVLFVVSYIYWPLTLNSLGIFNLAVWLICVVAFMALSIYDFRWMILPNVIVYPLILLTLVQRVVDTFVYHQGVHALFLSLAASFVGGGIFYILYQLSDGNWIGGGDVKLGFALGLLVGMPLQGLLLLFLSSLIGLVGAVPNIVKKGVHKNLQIPFGPCLMLVCAILVLFGDNIVAWYTRLLIG